MVVKLNSMLKEGRIAAAEIRRAQRVLAMILELHKEGYQRLAIFSGMSPSGLFWRCQILPYDSIFKPPGKPLEVYQPSDVEVAEYTSGDSNIYFGWTDAKSDTARQLAAKFVERFPRLARAGLGECFPYSGWFTLMLGRSEHGDLPVMFSDDSLGVTDCRGSNTGLPIPFPPHHKLKTHNGIMLAKHCVSRSLVEENDWHTAYQPLIDRMVRDLRENNPIIAPDYPMPVEIEDEENYHDLLFQIGAYWEGAIYYLVTILGYDSPEEVLSDYLFENSPKEREWDLFNVTWNDRGQLSLLLAYFCRVVLETRDSASQDHMGETRKKRIVGWLDTFESSQERPLLYPNPYYGGGNPLHLGHANARFCN